MSNVPKDLGLISMPDADIAYASLQRMIFARQHSRDLIAELERSLADRRKQSLFRPPRQAKESRTLGDPYEGA
jgi:hypothetical protein